MRISIFVSQQSTSKESQPSGCNGLVGPWWRRRKDNFQYLRYLRDNVETIIFGRGRKNVGNDRVGALRKKRVP